MILKVPFAVGNGTDSIELKLEDFMAFYVGTKNEEESNLFLLSLWREFDKTFAPQKLNKCPWAFFPKKFINKKSFISYLGCIETSFDVFYVGISYKQKGAIDNILFFSNNVFLSENINVTGDGLELCFINNDRAVVDKKTFIDNTFRNIKGLVTLAKRNQNTLKTYKISVRLFDKYKKFRIASYIGEDILIMPKKKYTSIEFHLSAIDDFHIGNLAYEKIRAIVSFLSIETNIYFSFSSVIIKESKNIHLYKSESNKKNTYQCNIIVDLTGEKGNEFIDLYPVKSSLIYISEEGLYLLEQIILSNKDKDFNSFIQACNHFYKGLEYTLNDLEDVLIVRNDSYLYGRKQISFTDKQ